MTAITSQARFIVTALAEHHEPQHFRSCQLTFQNKPVTISASGQYSTAGLHTLHAKSLVFGACHVINLREETHFFADYAAITLYEGEENNANKGLSDEELNEKIKKVSALTSIQIATDRKKTKIVHADASIKKVTTYGKNKQLDITHAATEQELVNSLKIPYTHIPITDHNMKAIGERVDVLINTVLSIFSSDTPWIHFHCQGGKARSAMAMILTLILTDAKTKTLEEITATLSSSSDFKFEARKYRKFSVFFHHFYAYCRENNPQEISWSSWAKEKKVYDTALEVLPESRADKMRVKRLRQIRSSGLSFD